MDRKIRLILADDNPRARHGLRAILASQRGVEVVGEASQGDEVVALVEAQHPDVVLMDVRMPGTDGMQAARTIKNHWPEVRVILISMYADYRLEAFSTGADAFLVKGYPAEELLTAILGSQLQKEIKQQGVSSHEK